MRRARAREGVRLIHAVEAVLPCRNLAESLAFYCERLGFRLELISPADDPREAVVSAGGTRLRLVAGAAPAGTVRLSTDGEPGELVDPAGTLLVFVPSSLVLPPLAPALTVSRANDAKSWVVGRAGMRYRDLVPGRQGGRFIASHIVIPDAGPVPDYVHYHRIRFQMIYCYRGWVRVVYEDQGQPFVLEPGDCVVQPPEIRHRVLESSSDLHVIELTTPAVHDTLVEHDLTLPTPTLVPERPFGGQRFHRHRAADSSWRVSDWPGFVDRDLGIDDATGGLARVCVHRHVGEIGAFATRHDAELRFLFVLVGTATLRVGDDAFALATGDAVAVPPGIDHGITTAADGAEMLDALVG